GRMPFRCGNMLRYLEALASERPLPPAAVAPSIPPELSKLVLRLLAQDRARRPASAAALVEELAALPPAGAAPLETVERPAGGGASGAVPAAEGPPRIRPPGRRRWVIAAGLVTALLLGLAALIPYLPTGRRPPPDTLLGTPPTTIPAAPKNVRVERID